MIQTWANLYSPPDAIEANEAWGATCGPAAFAAVVGRPVMDCKSLFRPGPTYTNFATMLRALVAADVAHVVTRRDFKPTGNQMPRKGECWYGRLELIQFNGSWMNPGVHPGAALTRTHWIAACHQPVAVYDVNADWQDREEWERTTAREIAADIKGCDGTWQVRGCIWVQAVPPSSWALPASPGTSGDGEEAGGAKGGGE